jgi:hypothetical protein
MMPWETVILRLMARCKKCGGYQHDPMRFGSGQMAPFCKCPTRVRSYEDRVSKPSTKSQKSSRLSTAEQLVMLAKLYKEGSLTELEFKTLKSQLLSRGDS